MTGIVFLVFLLFFSIGTGLCAGDAKSRKQFVSAAALELGALLLFFISIPVFMPHWKQLLLIPAEKKPGIPGLLQPEQIPDSFIFQYGLWTAVLALTLFLIALNCRKNTSKMWRGLGGVIISIMLFHLLSMPLFHGLSAWWLFFRDSVPETYPVNSGIQAVLCFVILVTLLCVFCTFRSKRPGEKKLALELAGFIGAVLLIWGSAALCGYIYCSKQIETAKQLAVPKWRVAGHLLPESEETAKQLTAFRETHPLFSLPSDGVYSWQTAVNPVPAEIREYTLANFDSEEVKIFCRNYETLLEQEFNRDDFSIPFLNHLRNYARICVGRAFCFREAGQPEKILPELEKIIRNNERYLKNSSAGLGELVRIACQSIWSSALVTLGPDQAEYLPFYRKALEEAKAQKPFLPDESGLFLKEHSVFKPDSLGAYAALPSFHMFLGRKLAHSLAIRTGASREEYDLSPHEKKIQEKSEAGKIQSVVMLALKCFRVENGKYPATLQALVPEYLEEIPPSPAEYGSDGKTFTLTLDGGKIKFNFDQY